MNSFHRIGRAGAALRLAALILFACGPGANLLTAAEPERGNSRNAIEHYNLSPEKLALSGYDPVSYFTQNRALRGRKDLAAQHSGATYHFATEENKRLFTADPAKYLPAYGGWCATAMAKGEKVEIDPGNFKITNGRLFLFFKAFYGNALKDWNKDEAALTARADTHWKQISGE